MKKINEAEAKAMISLLDDPSEAIYEQVKDNLKKAGAEIMPLLQTAYDESNNDLQKHRLKALINSVRLRKLKKEIDGWKNLKSDDLLEGILIIARYAYPGLDVDAVKHFISKMEKEVAEMIKNKSGAEAVEAMNEVILHKYGFSGNTEDYSGVQNSYINKVIENKMGNLIMLCVLYLLVARRLNIPLIGINSPRHFVLAFINDKEDVADITGNEMDKIGFFVDPFHQGTTYSEADFIKMLKSVEFYDIYKKALPASNITIIKRVLNNVIYAIHQEGKENRAKNLLRIAESL